MAVQPVLERVSVEDYLAFESAAEAKHELYAGQIVAMAGAGEPHRSITPRLARICSNAVLGSTCRYFDQDTKVVVSEVGSTYYPDGGIACPPNVIDRRSGSIDNPTAIFEVLSPSTEAKDRGEKFKNYALLPSLKDYVLINTDTPRVEVFTRQEDESWLLRIYIQGSVAHLPSLNLDLPLDDLYEDAVFEVPKQE